MKIVTQFLQDVAGIEIYPLISFFIFFIFFVAVTIYVFRLDKAFIREMSHYPLQSDEMDLHTEDTK
jgi:cbb3-type cytochrome oxidase subunit 3